ncbi:MAG: 16S rRNA (guanine(527)-N(7))-methyltransferase RsmG [Chloroflexia bacterium]|nr:16S rRNA (guanine(527)-N(7))-methyltransferase RsmG [Chloroflexia bacterium]
MPPPPTGQVLGAPARAHLWPGLEEAARASGVTLTAQQLDRFDRYRDLLRHWNTRFNLTAVTEPEVIERRLFLDAVRLLPILDRLAPRFPDSERRSPRLVDIGSGAGLPGLPIAICRPELAITLVEATGKKVTFLDAVALELELPNVRSIHARAEALGREPAHRGAYDFATARAVAALPALLELSMPLLREGGVALFPKGLDIAGEVAAGRAAAPLVGAALIGDDILPGGETRLVAARKTAPTPSRFPRRAGIPQREPLGGRPPPERSATGPGGARR